VAGSSHQKPNGEAASFRLQLIELHERTADTYFLADTEPTPALLASVIVIVGALTFFPAFSLGPIVEQLLMKAGTLS